MIKGLKLILLIISTKILVSCNDITNCQLSDSRAVKVTFSGTKLAGKKTAPDSAINGVNVIALGALKPLYKNEQLTTFSLNLPPTADSCTFLLQFSVLSKEIDSIYAETKKNNLGLDSIYVTPKKTLVYSNLTDTLFVKYKHTLQLVSQNCGYNSVLTLNFNQLKYTTNHIELIDTLKKNINTDGSSNFRIYLKKIKVDTVKVDTVFL